MDLSRITLKRVFIFTTLASVASFFVLLYVSNTVNRQGISEMNKLQRDISMYSRQIQEIEFVIATASALDRIEKRGQEMGFSPAKKIEYLR